MVDKVSIPEQTSEEGIIKILKESSLGKHATVVCRGCGSFWYNIVSGHANSAMIILRCSRCH